MRGTLTVPTPEGTTRSNGPTVALVHDYLTQRGGAERVALLLASTFPNAPLHTSLYEPAATFPEFADVDVRTLPINRVGMLRRHHRLALPVLAPSFSALRVDADVVICSSSGWAHGARVPGPKVVYCYAPARWLYQTDRYLNGARSARQVNRSTTSWLDGVQRSLKFAAVAALGPPLRVWDRRATASANRYLTSSSAMATIIRDTYGVEAEVLPPPPAISSDGIRVPVDGVEPGFLLCVARLLPYKNVDVIIEAIRGLPKERLVIVGKGPDLYRLQGLAGPGVRFVGTVGDDQLRWLYQHCRALVAASYEDYGLTPLEAASFGRLSIVLRAGGFLDTVTEETGVFFDDPQPGAIRQAVDSIGRSTWSPAAITAHATKFGKERFALRLRQIVDNVSHGGATP